MIKALIFDVDGVLITKIDFDVLYTNFAHRAGLDPRAIIDFHNENLKPMLLGEITFEKFLHAMGVEGDDKMRELKELWIEETSRMSVLDNNLIFLVDDLRKHFSTAILSNLTEGRLFADERSGLYSHFDNVFLSCKEHLTKPDEGFYRLALHKIGVQPEEAIFIDDKEQFVKGAENIGIHGILFKDTDQLKGELLKLGIT